MGVFLSHLSAYWLLVAGLRPSLSLSTGRVYTAGNGPCDDQKNFRSTESWLQESHTADNRLNLNLSDGFPDRGVRA